MCIRDRAREVAVDVLLQLVDVEAGGEVREAADVDEQQRRVARPRRRQRLAPRRVRAHEPPVR
eukprot:1138245-Prymnesium_polylepis.1